MKKILNRLFDRNDAEDVTKTLGNLFVSGAENAGRKKLHQYMLMDLLKEKKTLILANGALSSEGRDRLVRFITPHMTDRSLYELSLSGTSDSFDVLSAFRTEAQKADFVLALLSGGAAIPEAVRMRAKRYFLYAIEGLEAARRPCRISDLIELDPDSVAELISSSGMSESEKRHKLRFLEDSGTYAAFMEIDTGMELLRSSGILDLLSGDRSIAELLADGNVILLNGRIDDDFEKKQMLFDALFYSLSKSLETVKRDGKVAFLIKDADFISGDHIRNTLAYNLSYRFAAYIFVEDISRYVAKNGNAVLDNVKSFLVFRQGSPENAEFWSAAFGSREVQDKSYSYTKKKGWNPLAGALEGGVVSSPRKYSTQTVSFHKVDKPIFKPSVFQELKENEVMVYRREPLMRVKARIDE